MNANETTTTPPLAKDRTVGLVVFGALQLCMGGLCVLLIPMMVFSATTVAVKGAPTSLRMMVPAISMYGLMAVVFIWLGVGSILARRWARAVTLVLSWMWLVMGVVALTMLVFFMPNVFQGAAPPNEVPPAVMKVMWIMMLGFMGFIYIVLPGVFVLFYRSKHTKATCEYKDPHVRWTDRCPLPVLALSFFLAFGVFGMLTTASYGFAVPFFGIILSRGLGALVVGVTAVWFAFLARGTYKLKMWAWWGAALTYFGLGLSTVVTFSRVELMELYREMNIPEEQLDVIKQTGMIEKMHMPLAMLVCFGVLVVYLLWIRKYFVASSVVCDSTPVAGDGTNVGISR